MIFINIETLKEQDITHLKQTGIDIMSFSTIAKKLPKELSIEEAFILLTNYDYKLEHKITKTNPLTFQLIQNKDLDSDSMFQFKINDNVFFGVQVNGEFLISKNKQQLVDTYSNYLKTKPNNLIEVYKWLDSNNIGQSSLSLCKLYFQDTIQHPKLNNLKDFSLPRDLSDFKRCFNFCKIANLSQKDFEKIEHEQHDKLNTLTSQLDHLISLYTNNQHEELINILNYQKKLPKP